MREVEVKILDVDRARTVDLLRTMGAQKTFDGMITAYYFDTPDGYFSGKKMSVRLRKKGGSVELALKEKIGNSEAKVMQEIETQVDDMYATIGILRGLGLVERKSRRTHKHRVSYVLPDAHFEFDTIHGVPTYLEIETRSVKRLKRYVKELGYSMRDAMPMSTRDILKHYCRL